ncbi:hypothetical protein ACP70R_033489 [Stipagrostis hirtigluma subsp. patula]
MGKGLKQQKWSLEEDERLIRFVKEHEAGTWNWAAVPELAGLARSGKSCNTRWNDYLRAKDDRKTGSFTREEEETFVKLHQAYGNCWATIAKFLPGRSSYEIKTHWRRNLMKRVRYILKADGTYEAVVLPNENNTDIKEKSWSDEPLACTSTVVGEELPFPTSSKWYGCEDRSMLNYCLDETDTLNQQAYAGRSMGVAGEEIEHNSELAVLSPELVCNDMTLRDLTINMPIGTAPGSDEFDGTLVVSTPGLLYGDLGWHDAQFLDTSFGNLKEGAYLGSTEAYFGETIWCPEQVDLTSDWSRSYIPLDSMTENMHTELGQGSDKIVNN